MLAEGGTVSPSASWTRDREIQMFAPILVMLSAIMVWLFFFSRAVRGQVALKPFRDAGKAFAELPKRRRENMVEQKARHRVQDMNWRDRSRAASAKGDPAKALYWERRAARDDKKLPSKLLMSCNVMRTYEAHKNTDDERKESGQHYSYRVPKNLTAVTSRKQMERIVKNLLSPMGAAR